jgi:hypothetical protein
MAHVLAAIAVVAALSLSGAGFYSWLDGRTVTEGLDVLLHKSEVEHQNDTFDLGQPAPIYASCAQMRESFPIGVPASNNPRIYDANRVLDSDNDRWACEDSQPDVVGIR